MWEAKGLLAKWFGFQPSEIDELDCQDLELWCEQAAKQIKQRAEQARGA
ncbi:GpE family phage tail protein [Limnohabitans sp. TS-CS-82]|nr:GpE family phage tail protein [Limnohabitans sp. TS-CS-82]